MKTIDIKKQYKTREGKKVRLIYDHGCNLYPIIGFIENNTQPDTWTKSGFYVEDEIDKLDLIEVTPEKPDRNFEKELIEISVSLANESNSLSTAHSLHKLRVEAVRLHKEIISNLGNPEDYEV